MRTLPVSQFSEKSDEPTLLRKLEGGKEARKETVSTGDNQWTSEKVLEPVIKRGLASKRKEQR